MTKSGCLLALLCFGATFVSAMAGNAWADSALPPVIGPKKVCLKYGSFDLLDGERVIDSGGAVESVWLQVRGRVGSFDVRESEIFAEPKVPRTLVATSDGTKVYRMTGGGRVSYALYGHAHILGEGDKLVIVLSGPAFTGGRADAAIYRRFQIGDPKGVKCGQYYEYGWEYFLPDTADPK